MKGFVAFRLKLYGRLGRFLSRIGLGRIPWLLADYIACYITNLLGLKGVVLLNIQGNKMYVDGRLSVLVLSC